MKYMAIEAIAADQRLPIASFGHAGDGNLHVNVLAWGEADRPRMDVAVRRIFEAAVALGGARSRIPNLVLKVRSETI